MKLYNPFKPHICKNADGTYSVRKLTIIGWNKAGEDYYWWRVKPYQHEYCHFSAEEALVLLDKINAPKINVRKNKLRDEYVSSTDLKKYVNRSLDSAI